MKCVYCKIKRCALYRYCTAGTLGCFVVPFFITNFTNKITLNLNRRCKNSALYMIFCLVTMLTSSGSPVERNIYMSSAKDKKYNFYISNMLSFHGTLKIPPTIWVNLFIVLTTSIFRLQGICVRLSMCCDGTVKEARRTITLCCTIQEDEHTNTEAKQELQLLAQTVAHNHPYLTAADFFIMDRRVIFGVFSITTTYFIAILQSHTKS